MDSFMGRYTEKLFHQKYRNGKCNDRKHAWPIKNGTAKRTYFLALWTGIGYTSARALGIAW